MTVALVFLLIFLGLSQTAGLIGGRLLTVIQRVAPWQRSWTLLLFAVAPLFLAGFVALAVFVPELAGLVIDSHCHDGACGQHAPPALLAFPLALLLVSGALVPFAAAALLGTVAAWRAARFGTMLARLARPQRDRDFRVLDSSDPFAMSVGLVHPRVLVSSALLDAVNAEQLRVITVHEQAHVRRLDNLRSLGAAIVTVLWPRALRRRLLAALSLAAEQACDQAVSQTLGAGLVADTIVAVRRRQLEARGVQAPADAAEGGDASACEALGTLDPTTAARLAALEQHQWHNLPPRGVVLATVLAGLQVIVLSQLVHHVLEAVLR